MLVYFVKIMSKPALLC